jgi:hypothetical protein
MKSGVLIHAMAVLLASGTLSAAIRHVPSGYPTVQSGIVAAQSGDTVLIAPGRYTENINFLGKNIVVASNFILSGDRSFIVSTVIDGSAPAHPDTASCVLIVSGEDTSAVLEGLTLTGGKGTRWMDEHGAGVFREGGGVLVTLASPTIRNTIMVNNEAINSTGCVSAGGGAIRVGDGAPRITGNIITGNRGMYGAGIVLNYCSGAVIRNNVISQNSVYQAVPAVATFGGGGIWILLRIPGITTPNTIENNTIVGNNASGDGSGSAGRGGGVVFQNADVTARNNIIWGNTQDRGGQIHGTLPISYSVIEGGFAGTGNTALEPAFADTAFQLTPGSPAVDAGDPAAPFNDIANPADPGNALWPSLGTTRNDAGAYGGPFAKPLSGYWRAGLSLPLTLLDFGLGLPGGSYTVTLPLRNGGAGVLTIDSVRVFMNGGTISPARTLPFAVRPGGVDSLPLIWNPVSTQMLQDTLFLFHNDVAAGNPARVRLAGSTVPTPLLYVNTAEYNFGTVDVNVPERDSLFFVYNRGTGTDSVDVSVLYNNVQPAAALSVSPAIFLLAPGDSQMVTFVFYPSVVIPTGLGIYTPAVVIDSRRGAGTTRFQKTMRFRISGTLVVGDDRSGVPPPDIVLEQNYPNPFNGETRIRYGVGSKEEGGRLVLGVYDMVGRHIVTLAEGSAVSGRHSVIFNAAGLASGVYFCRLAAGGRTLSRRLAILK